MAAMRLVQLLDQSGRRHVAVVEEPKLRLIEGIASVFALANDAIASGERIAHLVEQRLGGEKIDYDDVYTGQSGYKLLPAFDHPDEPNRCLVTGTGLTHRASAENRQAMHAAAQGQQPMTDSMRMYQIGLDGGRPRDGEIGAAPEWFYKGLGTILRAHNEPLESPSFAGDGGDEAEIAGAYIIGPDGSPYRVGLMQGNEFSDHLTEAKNYLYLAPSKLRQCSIGPELIVDADFSDAPGRIAIERRGEAVWQSELHSGEASMCHTLANLEHHHFKHAMHRRPGDAHVHFLGADVFSFREKLRLEDGDVMVILFEGFGRALRNPIRIDRSPEQLVRVRQL